MQFLCPEFRTNTNGNKIAVISPFEKKALRFITGQSQAWELQIQRESEKARTSPGTQASQEG